jgi:hypothetical protein
VSPIDDRMTLLRSNTGVDKVCLPEKHNTMVVGLYPYK